MRATGAGPRVKSVICAGSGVISAAVQQKGKELQTMEQYEELAMETVEFEQADIITESDTSGQEF